MPFSQGFWWAARKSRPAGILLMCARMGMDLNFEKLVLRLLCAGTSQGDVRAGLIPLLRNYAWSSALHRAIFNAIGSIPSDDPELLRQLLPAKLTRMGFPDVEWEELFTPVSISSEEAMQSVRKQLCDP